MAATIESEKLLNRIEKLNYSLMAILPTAALVVISSEAAVGVLLGAVIATLSFFILKWQLKKAFQTPGKVPGKGKLFATYYLRFLGVFFIVFLVMYYQLADPVFFLVGLSVVVVSVVLGGGLEVLAWSARKGES